MADDQSQKSAKQTDPTIGQDAKSNDDTAMPDWLKKAQNLADHEESRDDKVEDESKVKEDTSVDEEKKEEPVKAVAVEAEASLGMKDDVSAESADLTFEEGKSEKKNGELPGWLKKIKRDEVDEKGDKSEKSEKKEDLVKKEHDEKKEEDLLKKEDKEIKSETLKEDVEIKKEEKVTDEIDLKVGKSEDLKLEKKKDSSEEKDEKLEQQKDIKIQKEEKKQSLDKAKKKGEVFDTAKDFFINSLGKVETALDKGRTAGAPEKKKDKGKKVDKDKDSKKEEVSKDAKKTETKSKNVTAEEKRELLEAEKIYQSGLSTIRDLIAPSSMEIRYDSLRIEGFYAQSFYVYTYPRYLESNWLSPVINFDVTMDISQFIYPVESATIMKVLKKKVAEMHSSVRIAAEKSMVSDPALETALQDAEELRVQIQRGQEKFFQFALYFTIYSEEEKKISKIAKQLQSMLGGKLVLTKKAELQAEHAFNSCLPICLDELEVSTNMNTSPLSSTFPFSSADLTSNEGILYGLNRHNDSLIIFDRFGLENANSVVFAKSGAGKSYAVKLEILRSMMIGSDVIVIDPENEYEALSQTVGGSYLRVSLTSDRRINPFDLPTPIEEDDVQPGDLLRANIINLHGLLKIMLGGVTPEEEAMLDKALIDVYAVKGITMETTDISEFPPPTMEDLHDILSTMEGATSLAKRLQKFTVGTYSGLFNKPTNIDLKSGLMVFCIRDLEDSLRPIAMYIILNYIWARVRSKLKKRILVIDEAWTMMQHEDSARFLFGLVKRARKYFLGITTITQDVEDFVNSAYGKPVVTNSSMQLLLKQAPASMEILGKVFNLTEGEKYMLLNSGIGQGLFFAGMKHVAIQIIASYTEDKIITTNPEDVLKERESTIEYNE